MQSILQQKHEETDQKMVLGVCFLLHEIPSMMIQKTQMHFLNLLCMECNPRKFWILQSFSASFVCQQNSGDCLANCFPSWDVKFLKLFNKCLSQVFFVEKEQMLKMSQQLSQLKKRCSLPNVLNHCTFCKQRTEATRTNHFARSTEHCTFNVI